METTQTNDDDSNDISNVDEELDLIVYALSDFKALGSDQVFDSLQFRVIQFLKSYKRKLSNL